MAQENQKIGILTFHRAYNYGAVLQAYALQKAMEHIGIECELVDYFPAKFRKLYTLNETKNTLKYKIAMMACRTLLRGSLKRRNAGFDHFIQNNIKKSKITYENNEDICSDEYIGFVTGSDQVWNSSLIEGDDAFFLHGYQFIGKKRYSYAASIGRTTLSDEDGVSLGSFLKDYDLISVRENSAAEIVSSYSGKTAVVSCDPTILLEREKWEQLCGEEPLIHGDYILLYYVRTPVYIRKIAKKLSEKMHYPVVCISCTFDKSPIYVYKYLSGYQDRIDGFITWNDASPYTFLNLIKFAKCVVTSSFHGTVFSILFHKPFLVQTLWPNGTKNIRVTDLLNRTHLLSRSANNWGADINEPIDWERVDQYISLLRQKGYQYLELINKSSFGEKITHEELLATDLGRLPENIISDPAVYAVKHKDEMVRAASRSGGIFTALSDYILENGGVVYGCRMTEGFLAKHIRAETKEDRDKMRGSKYIQSFLGDTFIQVKSDLDSGREVLFSGTSCQTAGLRCFLKKDYDNLYCTDIVCHGVSSKNVWEEYVKWQENKKSEKIIAAEFRNKREFGWKAHKETLTFEDGSRISSDIFKKLFLDNYILRPACYECRYKSIYHPGDITIGDYWGIDKAVPGFNDDKGVSLVLVNTDKGTDLFNHVKERVRFEQTEIKKAMQPALFMPSERPATRNQFWDVFLKENFEIVVEKYGRKKSKNG